MRDSLYDDTLTRIALPVAARSTDGAANGSTIDKNYNNNWFRVVMFSFVSGTMTDGTVSVKVQDSPDGTNWTDADTEHVQGSLPTVAGTDDDKSYDISYIGPERYVRLVATLADATASTGGGTYGAVAILSSPRRTPVAR